MNYLDKNQINYADIITCDFDSQQQVTVILQDGQQISLENDESDPCRVENFKRTMLAYENAVSLLKNDLNVNNPAFDSHMHVLRQNDYRNNG